jgi:hypothetical protein
MEEINSFKVFYDAIDIIEAKKDAEPSLNLKDALQTLCLT